MNSVNVVETSGCYIMNSVNVVDICMGSSILNSVNVVEISTLFCYLDHDPPQDVQQQTMPLRAQWCTHRRQRPRSIGSPTQPCMPRTAWCLRA